MADLKEIYEHVFGLEYEQGFKSYDIYDGSGLKIPGLRQLKSVRMASTYFNKFSPLNFRKLLGIKKRKYPHAIACMVNAYYNCPVSNIPEKFIQEQVEWLISISLIQKYGYHCWNGLGIYIDMKGEGIKPEVPGLIGTLAVTRALAAYYIKTGDSRIPEILRSVREDLTVNYFKQYNSISFFRYKPTTHPWVFTINASAKGAALVCHINQVLGEETGLDIASKAVKSIFEVQEKDGRWKYTIDLKYGKNKEQIDFHQAYIIKALLDILDSGNLDISLKNTIKRGLEYQNNFQLETSGALYYRYPKRYPYNIHNQLYAYYVNRICGFFNSGYIEKADLILNWTLKYLYNPNLGFVYGKYPGLKIKIPYARWGNSHALYLFSLILKRSSIEKKGNMIYD
ncbi:MAG: hypothetical protein ACOC5R_02835 [Elusimicrobiota bacterium]